ncbi:MAG: hypothetical protein ACI9DJ_003143 [Algoriphagus sp.]|jgi:hypothetical protein
MTFIAIRDYMGFTINKYHIRTKIASNEHM